MCNFLTQWSTVAPHDISEIELHPILASILTIIEAHTSKKIEEKPRQLEVCRENLRKILDGPLNEVKMQSVTFYREWKDGPSGLRDICRKVMDVNMAPVIASHVLEWSVQVFDNVRFHFLHTSFFNPTFHKKILFLSDFRCRTCLPSSQVPIHKQYDMVEVI